MEPVGTGRAWICSSKWSHVYLVPALSHALWVRQHSGFLGHCGLSVGGDAVSEDRLISVCTSLLTFPWCHWTYLYKFKMEIMKDFKMGTSELQSRCLGFSWADTRVAPQGFTPTVSPECGDSWNEKQISGFSFFIRVPSSSLQRTVLD